MAVVYSKAIVHNLADEILKLFTPPEDLTISQWAEKNRVLPEETSEESGKWKNIPFQIGIMDAVMEPKVTKISVMSSAQVGKTESILNIIGYFVDHDPKSIIFMLPTVELAEDMSKERVTPTARVTPCLRDKLKVERTKDGSNTILKKSFPGGHLAFAGSNSSGQAASRSVSIVLADEVDRFSVSSISKSGVYEGDPLSLVIVRQKNRFFKKAIFTSTPTVKGKSRIEKSFLSSDQRLYYLPAPCCGEFQFLHWEQFVLIKNSLGIYEPELTVFECRKCKERIQESPIKKIIPEGVWVKENPKVISHAGFHINEFYSPWSPWPAIIEDYLLKKDNPDEMRVWWNTSLGRTYSLPANVAPSWKRLYKRAEDYQPKKVPLKGLVLYAGADVQGDRIEVTVRAFNRFESWVVTHEILIAENSKGEKSTINDLNVWKKLDRLLDREWIHESGMKLKIAKMAIDAGHKPLLVYNFIRSRRGRNVVAVRGSTTSPIVAILPPKKIDVNRKGKATKNGIYLWNLGTEVLKEDLFGRLNLFEPTEEEKKTIGYPRGYIHMPQLGEKYFRGICSEKCEESINNKTRKITYTWVKTYKDNEPLDCLLYSEAAFKIDGGDHWSEQTWKQLADNINYFSGKTAPSQKKKVRLQEDDWL